MIPKALRELVRVSRRTAREFKQALEELGELINEKQLEQTLQRERIPVRNHNSEHPLSAAARRSGQRSSRFSSSYSHHFQSTRNFSTTRNIRATVKNQLFNNIAVNNAFQNNVKRRTLNNTVSLSRTLRAAVYQTQPFKYSSPKFGFIRNSHVVGSGMYSHFPKHNARMFSTYGPNMTHQVVENLSQSLRMMFLKGGKLGKDCSNIGNIGNNKVYYLTHDDESLINNDIKLASTVAEGAGITDLGCVIEFNLSSNATTRTNLPNAGIFTDDCCEDLEKIILSNIEYQMQVLKDIKSFKENIGSTSFKFDKGRMRLRFYCPNCDVFKMEGFLQEYEISTAIVSKNTENILRDESDSESDSHSEFSVPELESVNSYSSLSSASISDFNSILSSDRVLTDYYLVESIDDDESILSSNSQIVSGGYFDVALTPSTVRV